MREKGRFSESSWAFLLHHTIKHSSYTFRILITWVYTSNSVSNFLKIKLYILALLKSKIILYHHTGKVLCPGDSLAIMKFSIKTTTVHTLNSAPLSQLPSFTSLGSIGSPHLSDKIVHYITRNAEVQILQASSNSWGMEKEAWSKEYVIQI